MPAADQCCWFCFTSDDQSFAAVMEIKASTPVLLALVPQLLLPPAAYIISSLFGSAHVVSLLLFLLALHIAGRMGNIVANVYTRHNICENGHIHSV